MIDEHDRIVLTEPLPESDMQAGDVGTVVQVYDEGTAYEVEFFYLEGRTVAVETVRSCFASQVMRRSIKRDMPSRIIASAVSGRYS